MEESSHNTSFQPSNLTGYKHHSYITQNQEDKIEDLDFENGGNSPKFRNKITVNARKQSEQISSHSEFDEEEQKKNDFVPKQSSSINETRFLDQTGFLDRT